MTVTPIVSPSRVCFSVACFHAISFNQTKFFSHPCLFIQLPSFACSLMGLMYDALQNGYGSDYYPQGKDSVTGVVLAVIIASILYFVFVLFTGELKDVVFGWGRVLLHFCCRLSTGYNDSRPNDGRLCADSLFEPPP